MTPVIPTASMAKALSPNMGLSNIKMYGGPTIEVAALYWFLMALTGAFLGGLAGALAA